MSNSASDQDIQQAAERIVQQRVGLARKEEVIAVYNDLIQTIWDRLTPTLGRVTVAAIMERSLAATVERYRFMRNLRVTREGMTFDALREHLDDQERDSIRDGMKDLITNLIDLLAMLTGDIIVRNLIREIEGEK
ncbi:MAG TPA: hypothetical protein VHB77_07200 [Planctomycetaceae bacterium]|nr:hypothetical protein [Planctomycetaceae bacterium]